MRKNNGLSRAKVLLLVVVGALFPTACATMAEGDYSGQSRSMISREEIEQSGLTASVYEVVQRLRPRWLQAGPARSVNQSTAIVVFQDDRRMGDIGELRLISSNDVNEIRYLDASQAGLLPGIGSDHVQAAIVVVTISQTRPPN